MNNKEALEFARRFVDDDYDTSGHGYWPELIYKLSDRMWRCPVCQARNWEREDVVHVAGCVLEQFLEWEKEAIAKAENPEMLSRHQCPEVQ